MKATLLRFFVDQEQRLQLQKNLDVNGLMRSWQIRHTHYEETNNRCSTRAQSLRKQYRSFEILNLGKYERQYFVGIDPYLLPEEQRNFKQLARRTLFNTYSIYKSERVFQLHPFHGKKGNSVILVGPIDAPVTLNQVNEVIDAVEKRRSADILGFEFEVLKR